MPYHPEAPWWLLAAAARALQVPGQGGQPWLGQAVVNDLDQWPNRPLGKPRIALRVDPAGRRQGAHDQPARKRELDVGAYPVAPALAGPQPDRQSLGQPALDPAGRHRHHIRREWVLERRQQGLGQPVGQAVGAFGSVDVEHVG